MLTAPRPLTVDDNKLNRMVLSKVLRGLIDATIVERVDGTEVLCRSPFARARARMPYECRCACSGGGVLRSRAAQRHTVDYLHGQVSIVCTSLPGTGTEAPGRRRRMTQMNGDEATAILRSRGIRVPIIGLTGDAHPEDLESFLTTGASEVSALCAPARAGSASVGSIDAACR
jgi:CheY-like chemotaxis protein